MIENIRVKFGLKGRDKTVFIFPQAEWGRARRGGCCGLGHRPVQSNKKVQPFLQQDVTVIARLLNCQVLFYVVSEESVLSSHRRWVLRHISIPVMKGTQVVHHIPYSNFCFWTNYPTLKWGHRPTNRKSWKSVLWIPKKDSFTIPLTKLLMSTVLNSQTCFPRSMQGEKRGNDWAFVLFWPFLPTASQPVPGWLLLLQ